VKSLLTLLMVAMFSMAAMGQSQCAYSKDQLTGGGGVPWPWSLEAKFQWAKLSGVWGTTSNQCDSLFYFKSVVQNSTTATIEIVQYDPEDCKVIAHGNGVLVGKVMKAMMIGPHNRKYELTIRAFLEDDVRTSSDGMIEPKSTKFRVVLSLYPRARWEKQVSYEIEKLFSADQYSCEKNSSQPSAY
jgi:hypothetical protein